MNKLLLVSVLMTGFAQGAAAGEDPIRASFERMLHHEPYAGPTITTLHTRDVDPVSAYVNVIARGEAAEMDAYSRQVVASFERMLNHGPYAGPTALTTAPGGELEPPAQAPCTTARAGAAPEASCAQPGNG